VGEAGRGKRGRGIREGEAGRGKQKRGKSAQIARAICQAALATCFSPEQEKVDIVYTD